jgi:hypothetical protein
MKMIAPREVAARPAQVWRLLEEEGNVVITKDGKPRGILLPTSEETFIDDLREQIRTRAIRAVSQIRRDAAKRGLDRLSLDEIEAEIAAARRDRRLRRPA